MKEITEEYAGADVYKRQDMNSMNGESLMKNQERESQERFWKI